MSNLNLHTPCLPSNELKCQAAAISFNQVKPYGLEEFQSLACTCDPYDINDPSPLIRYRNPKLLIQYLKDDSEECELSAFILSEKIFEELVKPVNEVDGSKEKIDFVMDIHHAVMGYVSKVDDGFTLYHVPEEKNQVRQCEKHCDFTSKIYEIAMRLVCEQPIEECYAGFIDNVIVTSFDDLDDHYIIQLYLHCS